MAYHFPLGKKHKEDVMKRSYLFLCYGFTLLLGFFFLTGPVYSEEIIPLTVKDAAICLDVVDRTCVDSNDVFPSDVGRLYCFSRIFGARENIRITHVWYFGDIERARVALDVRSVNFRTYSSKMIQPHEIGAWHVDILGPGGKLLQTLPFDIVH
jgi:hypothetical protein